jgi:hypothetical protein
MAKPNAHSMCAQESSLHIHHFGNAYGITNVVIYNIYYMNNTLQKTKSNTLGSITAEIHYNSTGNQLAAIAYPELHIIVLQIFFSF